MLRGDHYGRSGAVGDMRVLVCGGRDFTDSARARSVLDHYHRERPFTLLIHGAARGADGLAGEWAAAHGVTQQAFPADWNAHGRAAGPIRNTQMLTEGKPDIVIAFPGGRGTENMIGQAERARVPVLRIPA